MPVAEVSASVAAKYEKDFYFDAHSPQGRTLRGIDYSQERDPDGRLTERALAYQRELLKRNEASRLPMLKDDLRDQYKITRVNKKIVPWNGGPPQKVHFGIGITMAQADDYAHKHNLHTPKRDHIIFNVRAVVRYLAEITDCPSLYHRIVFSLDHDIVLAMYDNYTQRKLEFVPEDEKEVLDVIRRELGVEPEQEAMWYYSINSEDYSVGCDWCVGSLVFLSNNFTVILILPRLSLHPQMPISSLFVDICQHRKALYISYSYPLTLLFLVVICIFPGGSSRIVIVVHVSPLSHMLSLFNSLILCRDVKAGCPQSTISPSI